MNSAATIAKAIIKVEDLRTYLDTPLGRLRAVDGVSLQIYPGETLALLGESGCGKSMTALSMMGLVPKPAGHHAGGRVLLDDVDLLTLPEVAMRKIRGRRLGMIFQEPMSALNPVLTVGEQIAEGLRLHHGMNSKAAHSRGIGLLHEVGMPDPERRWDEYPHQLSGGLKQRVVIAIALAGEPDLLIADEPTTALDVTIQAQILALLARLQRERGMAMLLITHDLAVVRQVADRVAVMYAGRIVEQSSREQLFKHPRHPYTRKLFLSAPGRDKRGGELSAIRGTVPTLTGQLPACHFADRCDFAWEACRKTEPKWRTVDGADVLCHLYDPRFSEHPAPAGFPKADTAKKNKGVRHADNAILKAENLAVHFPIHKGVLKRTVGYVYAVDGVSLTLYPGRTLALVGESGCGKTTLGRAIAQLQPPSAGSVEFNKRQMTTLSSRDLRRTRRQLQMIFQDPFSSMDPRMMVGEIIEEGMIAQGIGGKSAERRKRVVDLLQQVGMSESAMLRYPHEFSGGQRQRVCVARALALEPQVIVCDEPTSALDVSVQAQVLNLLARLQNELGLSYLFITHNMAVVAYLAHDVAVMYLGRVVEQGSAEEILNNPKHPYTQALLSATPEISAHDQRELIHFEGDLPSPSNPPSGCHFHPRCPHVMDKCKQAYPKVSEFSGTHRTKCFLYSI